LVGIGKGRRRWRLLNEGEVIGNESLGDGKGHRGMVKVRVLNEVVLFEKEMIGNNVKIEALLVHGRTFTVQKEAGNEASIVPHL
jgi:hypothetical protein